MPFTPLFLVALVLVLVLALALALALAHQLLNKFKWWQMNEWMDGDGGECGFGVITRLGHQICVSFTVLLLLCMELLTTCVV